MDNKDLQEIVLDKMTKVCVCKAISKAKIKESIKLGADTLDKVIEIHENGRVKRQEAEVQLEEIENKLKEKLLEIKN